MRIVDAVATASGATGRKCGRRTGADVLGNQRRPMGLFFTHHHVFWRNGDASRCGDRFCANSLYGRFNSLFWKSGFPDRDKLIPCSLAQGIFSCGSRNLLNSNLFCRLIFAREWPNRAEYAVPSLLESNFSRQEAGINGEAPTVGAPRMLEKRASTGSKKPRCCEAGRRRRLQRGLGTACVYGGHRGFCGAGGGGEMFAAADEGPNQRSSRAVEIAVRIADAVLRHLALFRGDVERAERPVPDRQREAEILVEMPGVDRVMDLVMRGTLEQPPGKAGFISYSLSFVAKELT